MVYPGLQLIEENLHFGEKAIVFCLWFWMFISKHCLTHAQNSVWPNGETKNPVKCTHKIKHDTVESLDHAWPPVVIAYCQLVDSLISYPGIIYLTSTLSHLEATTIFLMVCARDGGGLTAATNADVTIHIMQTTLAPAEFERPKYTFSVYEDVPEDTLVGTVKARESLSKCWIFNTAPKSLTVHLRVLSGHRTLSISFSPC